MSSGATPLPTLPALALRPYVSVLVLTFDTKQATSVGRTLRRKLLELNQPRSGDRTVTIIADGVDPDVASRLRRDLELDDDSEIDGFMSLVSVTPSWLDKDSPYRDENHSLCLWNQFSNFVAICCIGSVEERIQRWLDGTPRPIFRRVPPGLLNAALLSGEAKGLWLRAAHGRRRTKADAKNLSGQSLGEALNPLEDSTFSMGSARAELVPNPSFAAISGIVGTTPRRSKVWLKPSQSLLDYCAAVIDLLRLLHATSAAGITEDRPFPWLAAEVSDLSAVKGAYDLTWLGLDDIPDADRTPEIEDATQVLARTTAIVHGDSSSPRFKIEVGLDGRIGGELRCTVVQDRGSVALNFGILGTPHNSGVVQQVRDALHQTSLLTVHYESGHAVTHDAIYSSSIRDHEFRAWQWEDFAGFDVDKEKPPTKGSQNIHDAIAMPGDTSLFAWVVQHFGGKGYLTCDDGANEVADFVLLGHDESLALIHVKGAGSSSPGRRVSASNFEVVANQATKNLRYLEQERLLTALKGCPLKRPATWLSGVREHDRSGMLQFLERRDRRAPTLVLIVQPHITHAARQNALAPAAAVTELNRLRLVETMLNSARSSIVGQGSEFFAVGAL